MAKALAATLPTLDEPALLSWLLKVVADVDAARPAVADLCHTVLQRHANGPHLTVRALASRLLGDRAAPPPVTSPDTALLATAMLWRPDEDESANEEAAGLVAAAAGYRLTAAEQLLPCISRAVIARVETAMRDTDLMKTVGREAQELADTNHRRWADAFTGRHALVEDALQRAASGGRAALLAAGRPPADPASWEYALANLLLNDPSLPLAIERTRQPRPNISAPPRAGDPLWLQARDTTQGAGQQRRSADADLFMTVASPALDESCGVIQAGRFRGWRIIASAEEHTILPVWPEKRDLLRQSGRDHALELRRPNDPAGLNSRPFASDTIANWFNTVPPLLNSIGSATSLPLIGIDLYGDYLADTPNGLGVHSPLLVPTLRLKLVLGLQPADEPFVLHDDAGPALAMITWRTHFQTSDYHLPWHRTRGTILATSPRAFDKLIAWGEGSLVIREVIHGDPSLADSADSVHREIS